MREPEPVRYSPSWLGLREGADARARSAELALVLARELALVPAGAPGAGTAAGAGAPVTAGDAVPSPWGDPGDGLRPLVIHDLGCGSGSMARWLGPRLPGPQHWVLHDRDPQLLRLAASQLPSAAADGTAVSAEIRPGDLTRLTAADLAGADLVTASALLDLLTVEEVERLAGACAEAGCPALFTLSVAGRVELTPPDPLDDAVAEAFNAHQRRDLAGRRLLGPDAVAAATEAFTRLGARVDVRASPWQLEPADGPLTAEWLRGWVAAAGEQSPQLPLAGYLAGRLDAAAEGRVHAVIEHVDVLARWERTFSRPDSYHCVTVNG